jgi:hypothetical protein
MVGQVAGVSAPPYEIQLFHTFDASSVFISSPGLLPDRY